MKSSKCDLNKLFFHKRSKEINKIQNNFETKNGHKVQFIEYRVNDNRRWPDGYIEKYVRLKYLSSYIEINIRITDDGFIQTKITKTVGRYEWYLERKSDRLERNMIRLAYPHVVGELLKRVAGLIDRKNLKYRGSDETVFKLRSIIPYKEFSKIE